MYLAGYVCRATRWVVRVCLPKWWRGGGGCSPASRGSPYKLVLYIFHSSACFLNKLMIPLVLRVICEGGGLINVSYYFVQSSVYFVDKMMSALKVVDTIGNYSKYLLA